MIQSPAGYQGDVRIKRYLDFYQAGYGVAMLSSGVAFSPLSLFANGEQGGFYDFSDLSVMFQDAAGTTPVTAVEQPVGLVLDKSKGLVLGSELVTNGDFSNGTTGWTLTGEATISGGQVRVLSTAGVYSAVSQVFTVVAGKTYQIEFDLVSLSSGAPSIDFYGNNNNSISVSTGRKKIILVAASSAGSFLIKRTSGVTDFTIDNISVRELPGAHLSQSTAAARPVLSARVNLLTYTEQFDNAAWTKANGSISTNTTTAPDGTNTADLFTSTAATALTSVDQYYNNPVSAAHTLSVCVKANGASFVQLLWNSAFNSTNFANFDIVNGTVTAGTYTAASIAALGNGWYRCSITSTLAVANNRAYAAIVPAANSSRAAAYTGDGTSGIYIWGADLRPANAGVGLPSYQRVGAATSGSSTAAGNADYDTTGFPLYLRTDGTDDSFSSAAIDFTSTDKMSVFTGVRKLNDAAASIIVELSANINTNNGAFIVAPGNFTTATGACYHASSKGSAIATLNSTLDFASPITNVVSGLFDISGDLNTIRINGTQNAQSTADQGTGNFGNYPLYVARRGGTSLPFNGHLYSLIVVGRALTAAEITATETWVNQRTKAF